ncbi:MAG: hypothetical protein ACK4UK_07095 [Flavobacterium sp.]
MFVFVVDVEVLSLSNGFTNGACYDFGGHGEVVGDSNIGKTL